MLQLMYIVTMTFQQNVQALTRCHIMRRLIWVRTVCIMSHLWYTLLIDADISAYSTGPDQMPHI